MPRTDRTTPRDLKSANRQRDRINLSGYTAQSDAVRDRIRDDYRRGERGDFAQDLCEHLAFVVASETATLALRRRSEDRQAARSFSSALSALPAVTTRPF